MFLEPLVGEVVNGVVDAKRLQETGNIELLQDGYREKMFTFYVADFERIAEILFRSRRRKVSEEQRRRA